MISNTTIPSPVIPTFSQPSVGCETTPAANPSAPAAVVDTLEIRASSASLRAN